MKPKHPEIIVDTEKASAKECSEIILSHLSEKGYV